MDLSTAEVGALMPGFPAEQAGLRAGDVILALPSSGLHSNGYSLVRKVFDVEHADLGQYVPELGTTLGEALLTPTVIYVKPVLAAIAAALGKIASTANLAGEGTARLNESADAEISPNAADVMAALKDFYGKADPNVSYVGAATDGYYRKRVEPAAFSDGVLTLRTKDSA